MKCNFIFLLLLHLTSHCSSQNLSPVEGFVNVEGGRIWYRMVGSGNKTPLLIIHGGPGSRSCSSIEVYSMLSNERPVILYDQLGSGKSDRPADTSLWRLPRFVNEIDSLRAALGLKKIHLLGQSWGGAVLIEYLLTKKPKGVESAVFASPLLSTSIWMQDAGILLSQLSTTIQDTIKKYEELKDYKAGSYITATDSFYAKYLSVKQWPPANPLACDSVPAFNDQIYNYMWGSTEFNATGTLRNFDETMHLRELKSPVLFIAGQYDEARPETMYRFQKMVANSKVSIIENAGHLIYLDQPLKYVNAISQFLTSLELH